MIADKVIILGEQWSIVMGDKHSHPYLKKVGGYCDASIRQIVLKKLRDVAKPYENVDLREDERDCLRHEIIHAFLFESGLAYSANETTHWAMNEEMVDWIARQHEKIHRAFIQAGAIVRA